MRALLRTQRGTLNEIRGLTAVKLLTPLHLAESVFIGITVIRRIVGGIRLACRSLI